MSSNTGNNLDGFTYTTRNEIKNNYNEAKKY